jgi:hypothetical protein
MKPSMRFKNLGRGALCALALWRLGVATMVQAATPTVSIADTSEYEGQAGFTLLAFKVTLSEASTGPVSVNFATANGTAASGTDYTPRSGVLVFSAGQTSATLLVPVAGDSSVEPNETLTMTLSSPVGGSFGRSQATGTITNDDPLGEATPITLYRLYSPITLEHHYTTDANEYVVLGTMGWQQEGAGYAMYISPGTHKGVTTVPVFRLYHGGIRQHFWTTDWFEVTVLVAGGAWVYEGIPGYILPSATSDSTAVYRLSLANPPLHLWTTDANEQLVLSTQRGWVAEGAMGYVQKAESITTAAGITGSDGKVLLTINGQPTTFRIIDSDSKPMNGVAVGVGLDADTPGLGAMLISSPQDAFLPKFRLLVGRSAADLAQDAATAPDEPIIVQTMKNTEEGIQILELAGKTVPPLLKLVNYTGVQFLGVIQTTAQAMNLITKGKAGSWVAGQPGATRTTMTINQAVAKLRDDNAVNGLKAMIILSATIVGPAGWPVAATVALCGSSLDVGVNYFSQQALLDCPVRQDGAEVVAVTVLGQTVYACTDPELTAPLSVNGLFRLPSDDPKPGGVLQLTSKQRFGRSYASLVNTDGTVTYSLPSGDYSAFAVSRFPASKIPSSSLIAVPAAGGERNIPPRTCNLAESNANSSACLAVHTSEGLVCDATYSVVFQTGLWAACHKAVDSRYLTCLDKCTVPH